MAVTILDAKKTHGATAAALAAQRQALSGCLEIYDQFVRVPPWKRACAVLVSRAQGADADQRSQEEFVRCRTRMPEANWLSDMQLRIWREPIEPLPLELAHIVAESVIRRLLHEDVANPIFDATLTKLVHTPFQFSHMTKAKRR